MKKLLLFAISLLAFENQAQECVERIACSDDMVTVFLLDDHLYTWGKNQYGQLGNGTTAALNSPLPTINYNFWLDVSHARMHTIALHKDGKIWAWGNNTAGQLGTGNTTSSTVPVLVGSDNDWVTISAGNLHSVALKANGTLWGWGNNAGMEVLGNGSPNFYTTPVQISTDTNWDKVYAGYFKTFGIKTDGTLWGKGRNQFGDVGVGNNGAVMTLTQIGTAANWAKLSVGRSSHTLGLKTDGTLWAWGNNENGKLGDGTTTDRYSPVQIGTAQWKDIATGNFHSLGIKTDGTLWQWGTYGWINGVYLIPTSYIPVQVGTDTDWKSVSAGYSSSYALKENNSLWVWGYNGGWLGNGTTVSIANPVQLMQCPSLGNDDFSTADFALYPNPVKTTLNWPAGIATEKYEIIDVYGQRLMAGKSTQNQIDLSHLSEGLYFVTIYTTDGKTFQRKFLKE